jgi:hypothetical protein
MEKYGEDHDEIEKLVLHSGSLCVMLRQVAPAQILRLATKGHRGPVHDAQRSLARLVLREVLAKDILNATRADNGRSHVAPLLITARLHSALHSGVAVAAHSRAMHTVFAVCCHMSARQLLVISLERAAHKAENALIVHVRI